MTDTLRPVVQPTTADPVAILKALTGLRQIISLYPAGHPIVEQALQLLQQEIELAWRDADVVRIDVIRGEAHLNGAPFRLESRQHEGVVHEFLALGFDSIHVARGVTREELRQVANLMVGCRAGGPSTPVAPALAQAGVVHVTLGRLVELDTRSTSQQWPEAPTPLDPDYADSLKMAEDAFGAFAAGKAPTANAVRDLLHLLMFKVAGNTAALGQILAVKQYENHTYCHSVNVSILSLLLGRHIGLDDRTQAALVEGALLHDVGKTRVPIEILIKLGALDQRERRVIERHPVDGAAMLVEIPGLHPLTPTMAFEHHRHATGLGGYPAIGATPPHALSRVVSVADVYEALTGARAYRSPALPEQACLVLARMAGTQLDAALVKAFVNVVTFFPMGTLVQTSRDEVGVVLRATERDPLHPVIRLVEDGDPARPVGDEIDLSARDADGTYVRHVVRGLLPRREAVAAQLATAG